MTYKSKKTISALKKNKEKIFLFLLGYSFFIFDTKFVENISLVLNNVATITFIFSYIFFAILSILSIKVFLKKFPLIKYKKKAYTIFTLISIGTFFGFLTNVMNSHVITTFERFIY